MEASIGRNRVVVAVLLEHSVNVATSRLSSNEMAYGGIFCRGVRRSPNQSDRPDFCKRIFKAKVGRRKSPSIGAKLNT